MSITTFLLGRTLANREAEGDKIGVLEGVPSMGLDGLGSAAYGPEAALTVLVPLGAAGLGSIGPITGVILVLLGVLFVSYWQTIQAYPSNGGSYTVARENLGTGAGLLAAAALMVDYMLNVAVGISAGIAALTSAIPMLQPYTLALCLLVLALVTLVNLRGTKESGLALALPTYLFIAGLGGVLLLGVVKILLGEGAPVVRPGGGTGRDAGAVGLAVAARVRRRVHGDDGGGSGEQRRRRVPRAARAECAWHAERDRGGAGAAACGASRICAGITALPLWTRPRRATRACCPSWWRRCMGGTGCITS